MPAEGVGVDPAADLQSTGSEKAQTTACHCCRQACPQQRQKYRFPSACGAKLYHKQPAAQTVQHHAAKDHHWPKGRQPQYQKQADHKAECEIFHAKKLYRPLHTARCKQPLPCLQIILQQFCLPGIAYGLQYTGCRAPQQKGRSQQSRVACRFDGMQGSFCGNFSTVSGAVSGTVGRADSAFCTGRLTVCGSKDKASSGLVCS